MVFHEMELLNYQQEKKFFLKAKGNLISCFLIKYLLCSAISNSFSRVVERVYQRSD